MEGSGEPEVKYAKSGTVHIAYQAYGSGSVNLVYAPGLISHLDYNWKLPTAARFFEGLGKFAKVAVFDKRGTGLSDREAGIPTFEERMDDIRAVMDAAGFERAILFGASEGAAMAVLFAASYPSRAAGLILYGGSAKGSWAPDYPWEWKKEEYEETISKMEKIWGSELLDDFRRRYQNEELANWYYNVTRAGSSPGGYAALMRSSVNMDVRSVLPAVHVPTLVLHRTGDQIECGRYLASHISGARFVELPGNLHNFFGEPDMADRMVEEVRKFAIQREPVTAVDRVLATVVFTDIVDSTKRATELGDARWHDLLEQHNSMVAGEVTRFSGKVVKNTGDGFLATFDGPTRAIRCAWATVRSAHQLGIEVRAGIHTGECVVGLEDVSGIAVHIASRVLDQASTGEVMVSSTVKDLVYGSGVSFADRGEYELKGVGEKRRLFSVEAVA